MKNRRWNVNTRRISGNWINYRNPYKIHNYKYARYGTEKKAGNKFFIFEFFFWIFAFELFFRFQIKALVTQLEENQRQMNDALEVCKSAIEANDPSQASYFSLKIEPDFREAKKALDPKPV